MLHNLFKNNPLKARPYESSVLMMPLDLNVIFLTKTLRVFN